MFMFKRKYWSEPKRHIFAYTEKGTQTHDTEKDAEREKETEQPKSSRSKQNTSVHYVYISAKAVTDGPPFSVYSFVFIVLFITV